MTPDEAAQAFSCRAVLINPPETIQTHAFKAGVKWRDENPSEKVKALIEALEKISESIVNPYSMTDAKMQLGIIEKRCDEALEQWRGEK